MYLLKGMPINIHYTIIYGHLKDISLIEQKPLLSADGSGKGHGFFWRVRVCW